MSEFKIAKLEALVLEWNWLADTPVFTYLDGMWLHKST